MDEPKTILTVYIGNSDIFEWATDTGKPILMPELLIGCEELLYNDLVQVKCLRVESFVRESHKAYDFSVTRDGCEDTLNKIMEWSLENEEYEYCQRIKSLLDYIEERDNTF
jgi:hypothetical protein